jgi:methionine aminotransferase
MLETLVRDTKIVVVSDEVYEHVVFDQDGAGGTRRHESVTRYPGLRERSFVVSSFGKTYHVTGWKVAYCLAPRALTNEFRKAHQFIVFTVHHPSQLALADFMREQSGVRRQACGLLPGASGTSSAASSRVRASTCCPVPAPTSSWRPMPRSATSRIRSFVQRLTREHGVAAIPVSVFNPDGDDRRVIRFCFAKNEATLAAAGERLRAL